MVTEITVIDMGCGYKNNTHKGDFIKEISERFQKVNNKLLLFFDNNEGKTPSCIEVSLLIDNSEINKGLNELFHIKIDEDGDDFIDFEIKDMTKEKFFELLKTKFGVQIKNF